MNVRRTGALGILLSFLVGIASPGSVQAAAPTQASTIAIAVRPSRIAVPEPARSTPMPLLSRDRIRPTIATNIRRAYGTHVPGPPMLSALDVVGGIARHMRNASPRLVHPLTTSPGAAAAEHPLGRTVTPVTAGRVRPLDTTPSPSPTPMPAAGTGMHAWWAYHHDSVPGGGDVFVNVGTGNMVLADADMTVPHKGVDLTFQRVYNSQSLHDMNGSDMGPPSMYGNGWTNTFDMHMVKTGVGLYSVYDATGARYDYHVNGALVTGGGFQSLVSDTPGDHAQLAFDGQCGMVWGQRTGVAYYFNAPRPASSCSRLNPVGGYGGRLYQIIGRNSNNTFTFSYSWDNNDASTTGKVSQITVQAESGLTATLTFADVNGHRLLQQLTYPDGTTSVSYAYDAQGNLTSVTLPSNNSSGTTRVKTYAYTTAGNGAPYMVWAASPRWNASGATDGGYLNFGFQPSGASSTNLSGVAHVAYVNPTIPDGTSSGPIQSGMRTDAYARVTETFQTSTSAPTLRDTDGHAMNWIVDGRGRPTQIQVGAASPNGTSLAYLVTNLTWDAENDPIAIVDPAGNETDAAYDTAGNVVAVGAPTVVQGGVSYRPTQLFDYDSSNNLLAYCDPTETHPSGDWNQRSYSAGSDSNCTSLLGSADHWSSVYLHPSQEPYGELASTTSALGYVRSIAYALGPQGGVDYGLPTQISGSTITQFDSTARQPSQSMVYDANGNLVCARVDGTGATTIMSYDALNRLVATGDPDDASISSPLCTKTPGIAGSTIVESLSYYPDGSVARTQSPSEASGYVVVRFANGTSGRSPTPSYTTYSYDLDGNPAAQSIITTGSPNIQLATQWFDGDDRLVEEGQPADPSTSGDVPVLIRYIYDLTGGLTAPTLSGASVVAHGNLYEMQKNRVSGGWVDFRYSSYDSADRVAADYRFAPCPLVLTTPATAGAIYCSASAYLTRYDWDTSQNGSMYGGPGLLADVTDALGESTNLTYDSAGRVVAKSYSGDSGVTPPVQYTYDPSGRLASSNYQTNPDTGDHTLAYQYTLDGALAQVHANSIGTATNYSAYTTNYSYYADGMPSGMSATATTTTAGQTSTLVSQPNLYLYSYQADGLVKREQFGAASNQQIAYTYSTGGREQTMSDFASSPSISAQYDSFGMLTAYNTPTGNYTSLAYDPEGRMLQYTAFGGQVVSTRYNIRGDLVGRSFAGDSSGQFPGFSYSNIGGVLVQSATDQYDGRTGAPLIVGGAQMTYDFVGRLTSGGGRRLTYDAENRLITGDTTGAAEAGGCPGGQLQTTNQTERNYAYGADGQMTFDTYTQPYTLFNGNTGTKTLNRQWYWDRGKAMYTASAQLAGSPPTLGARVLDGYQADGIGIIPRAGYGFTISDLDFDGAVSQRHNSSGHSSWYASNYYHQECISTNPVPASSGYVGPDVATPPDQASDDGSDPGLVIDSSGRAYLSRSAGLAIPDYSSATPYASSGAARSADSTSRSPLYENCAKGEMRDGSGNCIPVPQMDGGALPLPWIGGTVAHRGNQIQKTYTGRTACRLSGFSVMGAVEHDFTHFGNYSRFFNSERVTFYPPSPLRPGATIPITVGIGPSNIPLTVTAKVMTPQSMTFTTLPGHIIYPGQITFSAAQPAANIVNFNIAITGTVANPLQFRFGGEDFEDAQWRNFIQTVFALCVTGQ